MTARKTKVVEAERTAEEEAELQLLLAQSAEEGEDIGDDELDIDLSEAVSFAPFTASVPVEVVKVERKTSKAGNPYLNLQLRVTEGEHEKRVLFHVLNLRGKGASFTAETLDAFDYPFDPTAPKVSPAKLVGLKAVTAAHQDPRPEYANKVITGKFTRYVSDSEAADDLK